MEKVVLTIRSEILEIDGKMEKVVCVFNLFSATEREKVVSRSTRSSGVK
jgi:hypothetical protein